MSIFFKEERFSQIPATTLNTTHSVGLSGITIWIRIQNGGVALELQNYNMKKKDNYNHTKVKIKIKIVPCNIKC